MCISNIGNRRPFPGSMAAQRQKTEGSVDLVNTVALKDEFQQAAAIATTPQKPHITVQHNYHDHANDNRADYQEEHPARGGVTIPFPLRLHEMLETIAADGFDHVISFQPHGRCFVVHKPKEFVEILPKYFKLSKLASFQRQLNLYGFQRLTRGRDRGGYYHELFLKDKVFLAHSIQRIKVKGTGVRARSNPDQEPNFWTMLFVDSSLQHQEQPEQDEAQTSPRSIVIDNVIAQLPLDLTPPVPKSLASPFQEQEQEQTQSVYGAFDKSFHYLDPFQPQAGNWTISGVDELLSTEAESFFEDFEFPGDIGAEIGDDAVFGDLLEQMIA